MKLGVLAERDVSEAARGSGGWSYEEAFCRNLGLISETEQQKLRNSRVAIAGMGGVGGIDLVTLARLGVGGFTIADPDVFEVSNINRQYGAYQSTLGRCKVDVMAEIVRDINPDIEMRVIRRPIDTDNVDDFLRGADVFVDAIDAFEIDARRLLFREASSRGIYGIGAGPIGFSTVWLAFKPGALSFDRYFDLSDDLDPIDKFVAYVVGMAPRSTVWRYMDLDYVDFESRRGPSVGIACQLAGGVLVADVVKILLGRGRLYHAPYFHQYDAYLGRLVRGRLWGSNRHPVQRLKRWWLAKHLRKRAGACKAPVA